MVSWLARSLLFIVAGAVLAYAVTVHNDHIDLQTTGVILLLVGVFDLLLNFGLALYLRQPPFYDEYTHTYATRQPARPAFDPAARPAARQASRRAPSPPYPSGREYPSSRDYPTSRIDPASDTDTHITRPLRRDDPDWH